MAEKQTKYVFVTGGVLSGLGKGITAASIGNLLKARGLKVGIQKCDPYLNVDAGLLNPREHGECFVTKDGAETDLDLGHYERFIDEEMTQASSLMSGRVLLNVIQAERDGKYEGRSVQIIPHVTGVIQDHIKKSSQPYDVYIVEIGGTVGDYESLSFIEAIREFGVKVGLDNCMYVHVVYAPYLGASDEFKTKPAQNSVRELRGLGIAPNILVCRTEEAAPAAIKDKLSLFTGVEPKAIALLPNAPSIYEVPLTLEDTGIADVITDKLGLKTKKPNLKEWREVVRRATDTSAPRLKVGIIAKYLDNADTYMSVFEALRAAAWDRQVNVDINWFDAEKLEKLSDEDFAAKMATVDGIVVPGGFGSRGVEGKIRAATFALDHNKPYLGLCYGMHMAVVAAARRAGLKTAHTTEVDADTKYPVIHTMDDQKGKEGTGGTMRLGNYVCEFEKDSLAAKLYGATKVEERHRHRYEANDKFIKDYAKWGIRAVGKNPERNLVEVIEAIDHPFMIASQYHPEYKSRPNKAHPLFVGFIRAIVG